MYEVHAQREMAQSAKRAAEMDAYLAEFDSRNPAPGLAPVKRPTRRERHAQQMADMRARMASRPEIERTPELGAAYVQYISDGLADTDGYFAPLSFQSWAYSTAA